MTTNAYDGHARVLASDSRWSKEVGDAFCFVDDTGFDKIGCNFHQTLAIMFAGDSDVIEAFKTWLSHPLSSMSGMPDPERINMCLVDIKTGEVVDEYKQLITMQDLRFTGTGAIHAFLCWAKNKCAIRAVQTAIQMDKSSGGDVKYFKLQQNERNFSDDTNAKLIGQSMATRGKVMYLNKESQPIPIQEAAKNDPAIQAMLHEATNGSIVLSAPCSGALGQWKQEDKDRLRSTLSRYMNP